MLTRLLEDLWASVRGRERRERGEPAHGANAVEPLEDRRLLSWIPGYVGLDLLDAPAEQQLQAEPAKKAEAPAAAKASPKRAKRAKRRPRKAAGYSDSPQNSYRRNAILIPGMIQAEDFDRGGEGTAYHDRTDDNDPGHYREVDSVDVAKWRDMGGGYFVADTVAREWLEYTITVPAAGMYDFSARVAQAGWGGRFHLEVDRVRKTDSIQVPATAGWQNWTTIWVPGVYLPAGEHVLRLAMDAKGFKGIVGNFNWLQFTIQPPSAPQGFGGYAPSAFGNQLYWSYSGWNAAGLNIERRFGWYGNWEFLATVPPTTNGYFDANLEPNTPYFYRIYGFNPGGATYSQEILVTTQPAYLLYITQGGVYSGSFQSLDANMPAIVVATNEPVVIENSIIRSRSHLISTHLAGADITVRNTTGIALNPNVYGYQPGRFLNAEGVTNVRVENNYMQGTSGIYVYKFWGNRAAGQTVKVLRNVAYNIDGRMSNGNWGYLDGGREYVQFFQINGVKGLPGVEIAWNQVINDPGVSLVEDNINIHASSGTPSSPIRIHDNFIRGAYPADPARDRGYSGGGIMVSDNGSAYVSAYGNQVVNTTNYGIAISSGHDNDFSDNRIISCGRTRNGSYIASQNVGAYIWNQNNESGFDDNTGHDNLVGWWRGDQRNDWWMPDATKWIGNNNWAGGVGFADEAREFEYWQTKLDRGQVRIGPM